MAEHTPGPWVVDLEGPFTLGGDITAVEAMTPDGMISREICTCMLDTDSHPGGAEWLEDAANARLISAAPDLLAACRAILAGWGHQDGVSRAVELARAAVAKATGEV